MEHKPRHNNRRISPEPNLEARLRLRVDGACGVLSDFISVLRTIGVYFEVVPSPDTHVGERMLDFGLAR
jgi:hypothetical protein